MRERFQEKSKDYTRMFRGVGIPFLISSLFFEYYMELKAIIIFKNNLWTSFLPKTTQQITLKEGIKLLGNKYYFNKYVRNFDKYKKSAINFFKKIISKGKVSKKELKKFFDLISKFWFFYRKTEFFYVDEAYKKSQKNKTIAKNLKHLEKIKNSGREFMNRMVFGSSSYLAKVLNIVGEQFKVDINHLFWLSKEEILSLYKKARIDLGRIKKRKNSYAFLVRNGNLLIFEGVEAKKFIHSFLGKRTSKRKELAIIGVTANPGKAKGRAKVLMTQADTFDFDKISEMIKKMKKGDILIAETTSPELFPACKKAAAILTNQGGLLSHAAIVSRELKIPCIVGLQNITEIVKDGDILEIDATQEKGVVKILKRK